MCVYWNALDVNNDYGGTHVFNHICMKVGKKIDLMGI
jgi:hypothetical protein